MSLPAPSDQLDLPVDSTTISEAAQLYCRIGFAPIPVYGLRDGRCSCGRAECSARGKHPIGGNWQKRASTDVDLVREAFAEHSGNIGILVGADHVVIDVDYYAGGAKGLAELGDMPPTLTSQSGSGQGEHRIFRLAPGQDAAELSNRKIATGVDLKTRAGQIVAAPSIHASGNRYRWIDLSPPALLPDALYERVRKRRVVPIRPEATPPLDPSQLYKRAQLYLEKIPPAVAGQAGHDQAFAAARSVWGWITAGLSEQDGWSLLEAYNARCQPPWTERELRHKWDSARGADRLPVFDSTPRSRQSSSYVPPPAPAQPATATDWTQYLITKTTKDGIVQPVKHHENAVIVLRYHPAWVGKLRYNEHSRRAIVADPPWHEPDSDGVAGTREWSDTDSARLSGWIRREIGGLDLTVADCERAVAIVSESAPCHPLREWLGSLQWDGQPRLDSWLAAYLGAELSRYTSLAGRWWMISAVARTFQPGCKADLVLILEGPQGLRKSSALRTLASPEYFSDTPIDIGSKDAYLAIQGRVIVELAELDTLKRADADRAKAFFSSPSDSYRPPYGRRTITVQRSCVFAGTVNRGQYLVDDTGNRRYLPVACTAIDLGQLARDRDQLWAEAVAMYRSGVPWWPSLEEAVAAAAEQEKRAEGDAWVDILRAYLETGRDRTTLEEVLTQALGVEKSRMDRSAQMRASKALTRLGWVRRRGSDGRWYYVFSQPRQ